jgi:Putative papain-like cysteine peptidase (DUF1796)
MKIIPLGLHCSGPEGINRAGFREYSYPFDWLWTPSKTTLQILEVLFFEGVENAVIYMTTGFTYYDYFGWERFVSVNKVTKNQMNKNTGLGVTNFTINDEYKEKLRTRLTRLRTDIYSQQPIVFIYADAAHPDLNYHLDNVDYAGDATDYLLKIRDIILPVNKNIRFVYFCWPARTVARNGIEYREFSYKSEWGDVSDIIKNYLLLFSEDPPSIVSEDLCVFPKKAFAKWF